MEGDLEGKLRFGVGADSGADAAELSVKCAEEIGEFERHEAGGEALHGLLPGDFGFGVAAEAMVMAAEILALESDLAAGLSIG